MSTKKKFDAVKFQRKAREELSEKHNSDREAFLPELKEKYGDLSQKRRKSGNQHRMSGN